MYLMNDDQIKMEILFDYYKAMRNQRGIPSYGSSEKLKNIDSKDYNFNYGSLVKHDLLHGSIHMASNGAEFFTPCGGITAAGLDIVETFIINSREKVEESGNKIIDKTLSYVEQLAQLVIIWSSNSELFLQALAYLHSLIG